LAGFGTVIHMSSWNGLDLADLTLTSPRLTLRPWRPDDAAEVHAAASADPWMREFLPIPDPYTRADALYFVTDLGHEGRFEGTGFGAAVVENATGRVAGGAGLRFPGGRHGHSHIGYSIYPWARGHGFAAEAADALARWGFEQGLRRIELHASVRNLASIKSILRAGFRFEGIERAEIDIRGRIEDGAQFARLAGDDGAPIAPVLAPLPAEGLSDGVITLRVTVGEDADALLEEHDDPASRGWAFAPEPAPRDAVLSLCAAAGLTWLVGSTGHLTIVDGASGRAAGSMRLRHSGPPGVAGIGYAVHPDFRGAGFTTRALRLLSAWAFSDGGFSRLELGVKAGNVASQRAALRAGFREETTIDARLRTPAGEFADEVRFALWAPG
jgi:RimJ/RimL family protein N-acetyltransferase